MEPDQAAQQADQAPQTIGQILQRCREFQSITLQDAAEATKIGKNYLRALETDSHQEFSSPAYLKGFLKIYATYLGLQAEDLIRLLEPEQPVPPSAATLLQQQDSETRRRIWQRLLLPAILLSIIIVVALLMRTSDRPAVLPALPPPAPVPATAIQAPLSSAQQQPPTDGTTVPATELLPPAVLPATTGVTLRIKAIQKVRLVVTMDEATTHMYDLTEGDLIEWRADRTISLELSDPSAVQLELNNKPLRPALPPGKTATLNLDTQGLQP